MALRIIIAGGGTGGHIFPAVAIARALQRLQPDTQLLFVGAKGKMEMEKIPQEGFDIVGLDIAGFNRSSILKNITLPLKLIKSAIQSRSIIREFKPDAVVGVGGYASFPIMNAAQGMGIPTLIQEQNSFAGKSNRILAKKADAICVAYQELATVFPKGKLHYTGNPVRKTISESVVSQPEGQSWLGIDNDAPVLLIIGGSLGAKSINEAIDMHLETLLDKGLQIVWQTGKPYYEQAKKRARPFGEKIKVYDFIRNMEHAYAAADFVISRAGALAIAELCCVAKPVIFVPYPYAAEDHQTSNAASLVRHGAALMVKDNDAKTELTKKLSSLVNDKAAQTIISQNLRKLAIPDADDRIARIVLSVAKQPLSVTAKAVS